MTYVAHLRGLYPAGFIAEPKKGTREGNFLAHLNTVFEYVGYDAPELPGGAAGPLQAGILVVVTQASTIREFVKEALGGFMLPVQDSAGSQRGHLFAMYPTSTECLTVDNLAELTNCVQVSSFPSASPKFSPKIKVGVCVLDTVRDAAGALVLGHETPDGTEVAGALAFPSDCHEDLNLASYQSPLQAAFSRLAALGTRAFGVRVAYAADKGLGGIGSILSGWGTLDALVFETSFSSPDHVVGTPPTETVGNFVFTQSVTAPGSILIQSSLGQSNTGQLVVLSQGGGACANCGGLLLRANLYSESGAAADDGVYEVEWTSVQVAPSVKGAPFVLRGGDTAEVARLTYVTTQSQNKLLYNGVEVGTWERYIPQSFRIIVNLNTNKTTLFIGASEVATDVAFVNPAGNSFGSIAAEFSGIDSGVMGWDEIKVQRLSDQPSS